MNPKILLTDTNRWPVTPRLAIAFSTYGCNVAALCPMPGHPIQKTTVVQETFPYSGSDPLSSLKSAIAKFGPDLIVPSCDRGVRHLHELHALSISQGASEYEIAALIERSLGRPESFPIVSSRYELLKLAASEGIRVPNTTAIRRVEDLKRWCAKETSPWIMKADGTWGGRGVRYAYTLSDAEKCFAELIRPSNVLGLVKRLMLNRDRDWILSESKHSPPAVIAQAYIDGRPSNCAVACWRGKVLAGISVEVIRAQGPTSPATVVQVIESPEMMFAAERIAERLGLSGFFGLDFMVETGTGTRYLIEMNPRCTPPCPLPLGPGHDLVAATCVQLTGQRLHVPDSVIKQDTIAYFPQAWCGPRLAPDAGPPCTSYQDIPVGEPKLIEQLLHPWCERSLLGQYFDRMRRFWPRKATSGACVFDTNATLAAEPGVRSS